LLPGSDWLYVKLYTGTATADQLLRDVVAPVVEQALATGAAERWFFIRYGDPDWHLRVRFAGNAARLRGEVLPLMSASTTAALARSLRRGVSRRGGAGEAARRQVSHGAAGPRGAA